RNTAGAPSTRWKAKITVATATTATAAATARYSPLEAGSSKPIIWRAGSTMALVTARPVEKIAIAIRRPLVTSSPRGRIMLKAARMSIAAKAVSGGVAALIAARQIVR